MRQTLLLALFLSVAYTATAQIWIDTGLKGGFGMSALLNKNILDDRTYSPLFSPGYNMGAKVGVNFGKLNGITIDAMYSTLQQKYSYLHDESQFTNDITWTNLDLYLMYRFSSQGSTYVEIGPMWSNVTKVRQEDGGSGQTGDAAAFYVDKYLSGVFGLGGYVAGEDNFSIMIGLRIHYSFDDFISPTGQTANYPAPVGTAEFDSYVASSPIFAQLIAEMNFGIGYFAKTTCGGRRKFFSR